MDRNTEAPDLIARRQLATRFLCRCAHTQSQHDGLLFNGACRAPETLRSQNGGASIPSRCACNRFTFAGRTDAPPDTAFPSGAFGRAMLLAPSESLAAPDAAPLTDWQRRKAAQMTRQHFTIPNTPLGWLLLWALKRTRNVHSYAVQVRGRRQRWYVRPWNRAVRALRRWLLAHAERAGSDVASARAGWHSWYGRLYNATVNWRIDCHSDVPVRHAQRLGVYLNERRPA